MTDDSRPLAVDEAPAAPRPPRAPRQPRASRRPRTPRSGRTRKTGWKYFVRDLVVILVAALLVSFLVKTFLVRSFYIPSASMENTLLIGDRILVNELVPRVIPLAHGDVVVFTDPGDWMTSESGAPVAEPSPLSVALTAIGLGTADSNDHLIKRVIGLPGDTVACCDALGHLTVNGVPIEEPYAVVKQGEPASTQPFSVTVPEDSLWVMGDNRDNSLDSRKHMDTASKGFVPFSDVVGRAIVITWPAARWGWLDNYPLTFDGVGDAG